jgi:predicted small secreted protein/sulfur carrier protein ThiS
MPGGRYKFHERWKEYIMMKRNNEKKLALLAAAAVLAATLLAGCGAASSTASSVAASSEEAVSSTVASEQAAQAAEDTIEATFTVTYADGTAEEFALDVADGTTLADALADAGLISAEEAAAGFVTEVNGVLADWSADQAWWCLTDGDGEMTAVGVADIQLHEGDRYAFTYTVS